MDFCAGGAIDVEHAGKVIALAARLSPQYELVVAVREWHPANHISFAAMHPWRRPGQVIKYQDMDLTLQPMHCVQHSFGAEFAPGISEEGFAAIFNIGADPETDQYSAFFDAQGKNPSGLHNFLKENKVGDVFILGLDHGSTLCNSALDAIKLGFRAHLMVEKTAVDLKNEQFSEMTAAGVSIVEEIV